MPHVEPAWFPVALSRRRLVSPRPRISNLRATLLARRKSFGSGPLATWGRIRAQVRQAVSGACRIRIRTGTDWRGISVLPPRADIIRPLLERRSARDCLPHRAGIDTAQRPESRPTKTKTHCHLYHSVVSKIISARSLLKTGISAVLAGDFWEILARVAILRRLETNHRRTESPINTGF